MCATRATTYRAINCRCPITGKAIDGSHVPANQTRLYRGQIVGFCCPSCPHEWDLLDDDDREEKLEEVLA